MSDESWNDWTTAQDCREQILSQSCEALQNIARLLAQALGTGRRVFVYGHGSLQPSARLWASLLAGGGPSGVRSSFPMFVVDSEDALEGISHSADVLLWLSLGTRSNEEIRSILAVSGRGVTVLGISGDPGDLAREICQRSLILPSHRPSVVSELCASLAHVMCRLIYEDPVLSGGDAPIWGGAKRQEAPGDASADYSPIAKLRDSGVIIKHRDLLADSSELEGLLADSGETILVGAESDEELSLRRPSRSEICFRCNACAELITVERRFAGHNGQCPYCLSEFVIPETDETATPPSDSGHEPKERRGALRFPVIDAYARFDDESSHSSAEPIVDVSLTGIGLRLAHRSLADFELGADHALLIDFPAFVEPLSAMGTLARIQEHDEGWLLGFNFENIDRACRDKLRRLQDNVALRGVRR